MSVTFDELLVNLWGEEAANLWRWQHNQARWAFGDALYSGWEPPRGNPFHSAGVRYRTFLRADTLTPWAQDADVYLNAAFNCGWGLPSDES